MWLLVKPNLKKNTCFLTGVSLKRVSRWGASLRRRMWKIKEKTCWRHFCLLWRMHETLSFFVSQVVNVSWRGIIKKMDILLNDRIGDHQSMNIRDIGSSLIPTEFVMRGRETLENIKISLSLELIWNRLSLKATTFIYLRPLSIMALSWFVLASFIAQLDFFWFGQAL